MMAPPSPHLLVARAPARLDFGGGWTDVPPYCDEQGGYVCNAAITRYATARVEATGDAGPADDAAAGDAGIAWAALRRAGTRVGLTTTGDFPFGAGLGGSSAVGVAAVGALAAWAGETVAAAELAERSRRIEVEDLGIAGGRQDHYAAAHGGMLGLTFTDAVEVERLSSGSAASRRLAGELARRCVVLFTGQSRISGRTISGVLDAYRARDARVTGALARMAALAREMSAAIRAGDVDALGALVAEHWTHQRALHPEITTERIDAIVERAARAGALGTKALGASGGGCVLVVAPADPEAVARVRQAVAPLGEELAYEIAADGVAVVVPDEAPHERTGRERDA